MIFNLIDDDQKGTIDQVNWSLLADEVGMSMRNKEVKEMIYFTSRGRQHTLDEFQAAVLRPQK